MHSHVGLLALILAGMLSARVHSEPLTYRTEIAIPLNAPNEPRFWFQARAGVIAPNNRTDRVVMTLQLIDAKGTHMYHGLASMWTADLGKSWNGPVSQPGLDRRIPSDDLIEVPVDATPMWHRKTGKLILTGATFFLSQKTRRHLPNGGSSTAYSVYDAERDQWSEWKKLSMPDDPDFAYARAGCTQALELPDGDILLPIYFGGNGNDGNHKTTVLRTRFDGETLRYVEQGSALELKVNRGLYEPSLTQFGNIFYLTIRNDRGAYLATSEDGLHFENLQEWKFDDGTPLGSCNTQQHWIIHSDGLFLAYTRNNADNNEVFRNRAPLFMAQVDPHTLRLVRGTETVLFPKVGKSEFGNFGVCNISHDETWVSAGRGDTKPNEPNVYIAKIKWSKPNRLTPEAQIRPTPAP